MNNLPTHPDVPDELDRLLSDFFKAQLKQPWPNAPVPAAAFAAPASEPSALANARAADSARSEPAPARRDGTARARFTLAASVALALGACWMLSNDYEPAARTNGTLAVPAAPGMLPGGGADATHHPTLEKLQENNAKPPKIDLDDGN